MWARSGPSTDLLTDARTLRQATTLPRRPLPRHERRPAPIETNCFSKLGRGRGRWHRPFGRPPPGAAKTHRVGSRLFPPQPMVKASRSCPAASTCLIQRGVRPRPLQARDSPVIVAGPGGAGRALSPGPSAAARVRSRRRSVLPLSLQPPPAYVARQGCLQRTAPITAPSRPTAGHALALPVWKP